MRLTAALNADFWRQTYPYRPAEFGKAIKLCGRHTHHEQGSRATAKRAHDEPRRQQRCASAEKRQSETLQRRTRRVDVGVIYRVTLLFHFASGSALRRG
jgi:hypothetical protein